MGYEIIDAEEFFESKRGKELKVVKMSRKNGELNFSPMIENTIEKLTNKITENMITDGGYKEDSVNIEVKTTKDKDLIEVMYLGIDNIKHLDIYILKK